MKKSEVLDEEFNFEKDLSINKFKLDEECISHSSLYFRYAEAQQEAKKRVSVLKNNLELILSERNLAIRDELAKSGTKFTESMIDKLVASDEEVIKAKNKLLEAESIYGKLTVAVQAMDTRRSELDNLTKLYCAGYFSLPNGNNSGSKMSANEQASREIRKNLNK